MERNEDGNMWGRNWKYFKEQRGEDRREFPEIKTVSRMQTGTETKWKSQWLLTTTGKNIGQNKKQNESKIVSKIKEKLKQCFIFCIPDDTATAIWNSSAYVLQRWENMLVISERWKQIAFRPLENISIEWRNPYMLFQPSASCYSAAQLGLVLPEQEGSRAGGCSTQPNSCKWGRTKDHRS